MSSVIKTCCEVMNSAEQLIEIHKNDHDLFGNNAVVYIIPYDFVDV